MSRHPEIRPRRSALYVPGSNARALEKARGLDADVLVFDLEDGVAPDRKVRRAPRSSPRWRRAATAPSW